MRRTFHARLHYTLTGANVRGVPGLERTFTASTNSALDLTVRYLRPSPVPDLLASVRWQHGHVTAEGARRIAPHWRLWAAARSHQPVVRVRSLRGGVVALTRTQAELALGVDFDAPHLCARLASATQGGGALMASALVPVGAGVDVGAELLMASPLVVSGALGLRHSRRDARGLVTSQATLDVTLPHQQWHAGFLRALSPHLWAVMEVCERERGRAACL